MTLNLFYLKLELQHLKNNHIFKIKIYSKITSIKKTIIHILFKTTYYNVTATKNRLYLFYYLKPLTIRLHQEKIEYTYFII